MTANEFVSKWYFSRNHLELPTVGIHVGWNLILPDSKVETLFGVEAWNKVIKSTPPWFKIPQTFEELKKSKNEDYLQIVSEEVNNGKIDYYRNNGLNEPYFCIFAKCDGTFMLLGDGNHRLLDCIYLMNSENISFSEDINKATVDIIYLKNFEEVILPKNIWKENWK